MPVLYYGAIQPTAIYTETFFFFFKKEKKIGAPAGTCEEWINLHARQSLRFSLQAANSGCYKAKMYLKGMPFPGAGSMWQS